MTKLTYFTPSFNRANTLPKLYESFKSQTNKNFEWLVVDDGSIDGTKSLVEGWQKENKVKINFVQKENGGKHTAINLALDLCKTEFFACIDSDDCVSDDATDVIYKYIEEFGGEQDVVGFVGRNTNFDGKIVNGGGWPKQTEKICFYNLPPQDTILIFKTDIINKYKFPIFEGEKFVTESVLYQQFLYDYKVVAMMELIHPIEYREDGYTAQGMNLFFKNPKGFIYTLKSTAYFTICKEKGFLKKVKKATNFYAWRTALKQDKRIASNLKIKFPYNFLGNIAKILFVFKRRKRYNEFLEQQKNR